MKSETTNKLLHGRLHMRTVQTLPRTLLADGNTHGPGQCLLYTQAAVAAAKRGETLSLPVPHPFPDDLPPACSPEVKLERVAWINWHFCPMAVSAMGPTRGECLQCEVLHYARCCRCRCRCGQTRMRPWSRGLVETSCPIARGTGRDWAARWEVGEREDELGELQHELPWLRHPLGPYWFENLLWRLQRA